MCRIRIVCWRMLYFVVLLLFILECFLSILGIMLGVIFWNSLRRRILLVIIILRCKINFVINFNWENGADSRSYPMIPILSIMLSY